MKLKYNKLQLKMLADQYKRYLDKQVNILGHDPRGVIQPECTYIENYYTAYNKTDADKLKKQLKKYGYISRGLYCEAETWCYYYDNVPVVKIHIYYQYLFEELLKK